MDDLVKALSYISKYSKEMYDINPANGFLEIHKEAEKALQSHRTRPETSHRARQEDKVELGEKLHLIRKELNGEGNGETFRDAVEESLIHLNDLEELLAARNEAEKMEVPPEGFMFATSAELFKELGAGKQEAETQERELNAVIRRSDMKAVEE